MFPFHRILVRSHEIGLLFKDDNFQGFLEAGRHWVFDPLRKKRVDVMSLRTPDVHHSQIDLLVRSGQLESRATVVDLKDNQRGIVWVDGRIHRLLGPGQYAFWNKLRDVEVEIVPVEPLRLEHPKLSALLRGGVFEHALECVQVEHGRVGVVVRDGKIVESLPPGRYAYWKGVSGLRVVSVDLRETMLDITGQDLMTADKVTVRINAVVTYKVADAIRAVQSAEDFRQSLYREAQLALRSSVAAQDLDAFLASKEDVAATVQKLLQEKGAAFGVEIASLGIRDVILPGDMKALLNRVTEAKKAAEANLIVRREETAAMRSQANTAKLLENNPTLMRLRELEVLEKVAANSKLQVLIGEKGLSDRVVNLL